MALDGVMVDVPDTPGNAHEYPRAEGGTRRPFPQVRIVGLAECGSHAVVSASIGTIHDGERALTTQLTSALTDQMLILADRGFYSFQLFRAYRAAGAQLLWRLSATVQPTITKVLPDGSYLAEITHKHGRAGKTRIHADQIDNQLLATHITVRIVDYRVSDPDTDEPGELFRLVPTILDPAQASAQDLAALYHERWEIESAFREIEIYLRDGAGIRSKSPEMVRQEIWGLLLAHYAVRAFMSEAADTVDIDPDRISFTRTLNIIRRNVTIPPGPGSRVSAPWHGQDAKTRTTWNATSAWSLTPSCANCVAVNTRQGSTEHFRPAHQRETHPGPLHHPRLPIHRRQTRPQRHDRETG